MECLYVNQPLFQSLCKRFPQIDVRLIRATLLEHGDDVKIALSFLSSENEKATGGALETASDESEFVEQDENSTPSCSHQFQTIPRVALNAEDEDEANTVASEVQMVDDRALASECTHQDAGYDCSISDSISSSGDFSVSVTSLEETVHDARADKESVMKLIEEISHLRAKADKESLATQKAKVEAVEGGKSILAKVEAVQKEIALKQESNWVREGEIYGEKAVLASEARELRLRLTEIKQQKEKAITSLHAIQAALQERLDMAIKDREIAEEEKRVNEERANKLLEMEETRMAAIIEESKKLETEAEACTQIREFLINNGSTVDSLQGEMCVLCEDVDTFKKQVEEGMWSSISTTSFPSRVHPEGPYSFRKFSRSSSAASSQELGQSQDGSCTFGKYGLSTSTVSLNQGLGESTNLQGDKEHDDVCAHEYLSSLETGGRIRGSSSLSSVSSDIENDYTVSMKMSARESRYDAHAELGEAFRQYFGSHDGMDLASTQAKIMGNEKLYRMTQSDDEDWSMVKAGSPKAF